MLGFRIIPAKFLYIKGNQATFRPGTIIVYSKFIVEARLSSWDKKSLRRWGRGFNSHRLHQTRKYRMMLPCSQCRKICFLDDFHEIAYSAEAFSAFCSKECKDNWYSRVPPEYDFDCTCEGCKRTLGQGQSPVEFWFYTEPYYFCGQMCRDKWLLSISDNR
jgi:hypothetical protein